MEIAKGVSIYPLQGRAGHVAPSLQTRCKYKLFYKSLSLFISYLKYWCIVALTSEIGLFIRSFLMFSSYNYRVNADRLPFGYIAHSIKENFLVAQDLPFPRIT